MPALEYVSTMTEGGASFWDTTSGIYDSGVDYILGNNLRPIVLERLGSEGALGETVEFGCGTGYFTPLLAQLSTSVMATDISERMLDRVRVRTADVNNILIRNENCEHPSFPDASFDTAFLGLTFQLVDGQRSIGEMHRILRHGGRLIMAIPTMEHLNLIEKVQCVMRNIRIYSAIRPPGTRLYTQQSLRPVIVQGGFTSFDMESVRDADHPSGFSGLYIRARKT